MIDMRLVVSALLETVTQHQRNFERIAIELRDIKIEMRDMRGRLRSQSCRKNALRVQIHDHLHQWVRLDNERDLSCSEAIVDLQRVKTAASVSEAVG